MNEREGILNKKIFFIGTLPPPIDGQSKIASIVLETMYENNADVMVLNLNRARISRTFTDQIRRFFGILLIYSKVILSQKNVDSIYFTISESKLGNVKDLILYLLIYKRLKLLTIHMLGGANMDKILNNNSLLSMLNVFFMKKMRNVIVEGARGQQIFAKTFTKNNIHITPNFADEFLFSSKEICLEKYENIEKIKLLYLSNMIPEKGYLTLVKAIQLLPSKIMSQFEITFVGGFQHQKHQKEFNECIRNMPMIKYLGPFIDGEKKKSLYLSSHIFCLPTYYPYEGQPVSILEAYATGCAVITTEHGGILDIFKDNINGFTVKANSPAALSSCMRSIATDRQKLKYFALRNIEDAITMYTKHRFKSQISDIFFLTH
jgi:glycosyltransferase involved in cell wall biosynthesis